MNVRWRHEPEAQWEADTMVLVQPSIRRALAFCMLGVIPLVLFIGWLKGFRSASDGSIVAAAVLLASSLIWAAASRTIAITATAIELRGIAGRRIRWKDVETVKGVVTPKRSFVIVTGKNRKIIAVDSTLYGWEEFVEKVPKLARGAGPSLREAIRTVQGTPSQERA